MVFSPGFNCLQAVKAGFTISALKELCRLKRFSIKGILYQLLIDPLTGGLRQSIASLVRPGEKVIDVACGTGALSLALSGQAAHVTGTDLSEDMIITARRMAMRRGTANISFEQADATDLSSYPEKWFDVAVTSMALHQFDNETALKVLSGMNRIAGRIIMADYNCPMAPGPASALARTMEHIAGGDHYRNFRSYMDSGGIPALIAEAGLTITRTIVRGSGVFVVVSS